MRGPQLVVLSRADAEALDPDGVRKVVCISVTDPTAPPARLSPKFAAILRLSFHDLGPEDCPEGTLSDCGRVRFMGQDDAGAVVRFAAEHRDAEVLVIHCEAGISRSRSIAEALFDAFDRRAPNQHVYRSVMDAFRRNQPILPETWIDYRWLPRRRGPR